MQARKMTFSSLLMLVFVANLAAQIKSPSEFLPHQYSKEFTPHHLLVDYFEYVAANSDRVQVREIGRTNEHRPMILAFISSPANMANLEEIRHNNLRLAGLEKDAPGNIENAKAIVWLGYSVHGNEAGGAEASMQVLYDLVTNKNNAHAWLENTVVIMEPSVNPDGFNRYSNWNNQVSSIPSNASSDAREHDEPWPGGRVNHYLFDLNRDWAWQTQVETQNRVRVYQQWMPHVAADLHEMGYTSPYYFAPAAPPYHDFITDWQSEFQSTIGRNHAKYFDKEGWGYFTKEVFDLFYPSYGDTYPIFNGAIGMTYEQGGHGFAGRAIRMPNADTLKLADRIAHHATTSLSTVEATSQNAQRVISEFVQYFKRSAENPPGPYKTYVIKHNNNPGKLRALCGLLDKQGIEYGHAGPVRTISGWDYTTGAQRDVAIESGDLVISAYQPRAVLTQILFDPESHLEDSLTYDITSWSLPYAYGVQGYALKEKVVVQPGFTIPEVKTQLQPGAYVYALRWGSLDDGKFLAAALDAGLHPRYAGGAFTVDKADFDAGTVLFMRLDHRTVPGFEIVLGDLSAKFNIPLISIQTGFMDSGRDFGSSSYRLIEQPKVLTISGSGVSANEFGQVWHFFEQILHYPITVTNLDELGSVHWSDYNLLVLPDGYYTLPDGVMRELKSWVSGGGKVIAISSALSQFRDKEGFALKRYAESSKEDDEKKEDEKDRLQLRLESYESGERRDISAQIPGAVFKAHVDQTHPLGYGLGEYYFTLKTGTASYEHLVDAANVIYLTDDLTHYGFAGYKALEHQKNSVIAAVENKGRGTIVYFVDNPLYRSFWENGKFLFCNALFFAGN